LINQRKTVGFLLLVFDDDVTTQNKKFGNERRKKKNKLKMKLKKADQIRSSKKVFCLF